MTHAAYQRRHVRKSRTGKIWRSRLRPQAVAPNGVDLGVVRQQAERLREPPLRPGIGGKPLMKQTYRSGEPRVLKIAIEGRQVFGQHQALERKYARGQTGDVKAFVLRVNCLLCAPPGDEQLALEHVSLRPLRRIHEDLVN